MTNPDQDKRRRVRSYVRREGRLTPAQQRALDELWSQWGIDFSPAILDLVDAFGRDAPRVLEIGFGNGDTLATVAARNPDIDYIGIEVHRPGVGRLLNRLERDALGNVRVICHDAVEVLEQQLAHNSLDGVNIFFPDPWPKKRHHKRRLIQPAFLDLLAPRMRTGATLHVATDWVPYAEHIAECLDASEAFDVAPIRAAADIEALRPETKFERRGLRLGHEVRDLIYARA